jgi:glycerol-3-phosphate dehydrogenase
MARTLDDVLTRRTRARLLDREAALAAAPAVVALLAPELDWDAAEQAAQLADFEARCRQERQAAATSGTELITADVTSR